LRPHCVSSHRDHASGPPELARSPMPQQRLSSTERYGILDRRLARQSALMSPDPDHLGPFSSTANFPIQQASSASAQAALTDSGKADYLDMERRWLSLARSYEFAERLSSFTEPFRNRRPSNE
jgi:hypothetical protein